MRLLIVLVALALCSCREARDAEAPAITLEGRVTDAAGVLPPDREAEIERKLAAYEASTGHQFVVITATDLQGRDVADFTRDLGNAWGIGDAKSDDGIILLVAPKERKVRLATGLGMEKQLTDQMAAEVIRTAILPRFKAGDMPGGIDAGVDATIAAVPAQP